MAFLPSSSSTPLASLNLSGKVKQTVYNVRDYGAVGDGSTDDTVAIQNAINAASSAGGGTTFIPQGNYKITAALTPLSKVRIQGAGSGSTTVLPYGTNFPAFQNLASLGSPTTDCEICDFKIDGSNIVNATYSPFYKGIYMQYCLRLKIHGLYIYNTYATGIGTDFLVDSIIDRCVLDSCGVNGTATGQAGTGANGIGIGTGAYAIESWIVSNCVAKNTGNNGIMMEDQYHTTRSAYMTVSNCTSYGAKVGFLNSGTSKVQFNNCWAFNSVNQGFLVDTGDIGTISGNYNPQEVDFVGCYAFGNGTGSANDGFTVVDNKPDGTLSNVNFTNCVAGNNSQHGFQVKNSNKISMNNCVAYSNVNNGILCYSSTSLAPANKVSIIGGFYYNNGTTGVGDGVRVGGSSTGSMDSCLIQGVTCYDDQGTKRQRYGVSLTGTVTNIKVSNNKLLGNNTAPYNIGTASASITFNNNEGTSYTQGATYRARTTVSDVAYSILTTDSEVAYTSLTAGRTATLPTAVGVIGQTYIIKDETGTAATNNITIATTSAQTIDGASSLVINTNYGQVTLYSDGANWFSSGGLYNSATQGFVDLSTVQSAIAGAKTFTGILTAGATGNGKTNFQITDTGTNSGMTIGGDTTLYRSAANTLKTDTTMIVGATLSVATATTTDKFNISGNVSLLTAGNKIKIATGTNASAGTGTLSGGTVTISTTAVTANSLIFLTDTASSLTNVGTLSVTAKSAGTSFTVTSANALDTSTFNWFMIN